MIQSKRINGIDVSYTIADPKVDDIYAAFKLGATVKALGLAAKADVAANLNYANNDTGTPIGRVIVDGKTVISDISKTVARDELYMMPDKSLHIGKAPKGALWALQGSPPLLRNGVNVVADGLKRDQLDSSAWSGKHIQIAYGITLAGWLVVARTMCGVTLDQLTAIMAALGSVDAIKGDGGGSAYLWPADNGWGRKMGVALVVKKGEVEKLPRQWALSDGHGEGTAGKRTFKFPDGYVMKENEFNRAVVAKLDVHLRRCGLRTLLVAPTDDDTPLVDRVAKANKEKADAYLSVHANAFGIDWNSVRGIETFHSLGSASGKRYAEILHRHLIGGTRLPNRGVKTTTSLYEVLKTDMPTVLVECAFMTNIEDATLLRSEAYRNECAEELARGICEIEGIAYVRETVEDPPEGEVIVLVNGKRIANGTLIKGVTQVPLRAVGDALNMVVGWNPKTRTATLTGGL